MTSSIKIATKKKNPHDFSTAKQRTNTWHIRTMRSLILWLSGSSSEISTENSASFACHSRCSLPLFIARRFFHPIFLLYLFVARNPHTHTRARSTYGKVFFVFVSLFRQPTHSQSTSRKNKYMKWFQYLRANPFVPIWVCVSQVAQYIPIYRDTQRENGARSPCVYIHL